MANGIFGTNTDILFINRGGAGDYSGASGVFVDNVNRIISLTGDYASAIPQISANSANITELSSKFEDCCSSVQQNINNLSSSITNLSGDVINKLDISSFSAVSGDFITISDLTPYATKTYVDSKDPVLIGDSNVTATSSKVDNHTQWNLAVNGTPVVTDTKLIGDNCVTAHTTETSGEWIVGLVQSAYSAINEVSNKLDKSFSSNFYPMNSNPSGYLTAHQSLAGYATTAQVNTVSSILSAGLDYVSANGGKTYTGVSPIVVNNDEVKISAETWDLSAGNGITFTDFDELGVTRLDVTGGDLSNYYQKTETSSKQEISAALTALNNTLSAAIDYVSANAGITYSAGEGIDISVSGDKTIITNNISAGPGISLVYDEETNKIRIDGEGREYSGVAPIQVNNTTNKISITGQSLSAGPNIDIFASGGYIVISSYGGNTYCYNFPNGVTSVDLSTFNNYNKVTIVHNNDGMQDYHLYWDGKTKVIPSGLYCEMVKGKDIQNNIKWSFAASGWVNENWWDWD